ncbi:MAG: type IV pilus assembly protein PilM [Patescibacteria group bacterium]|jgi:type IV pilus assembly protein PilM
MALFGGKKAEPTSQGLLGVDLGTAGMKIVELAPAEGGRMKLVTYGYAEPSVPVGARATPLDDLPKTEAVLKRILAEGGFTAKRAVAALPTTNVFHAIISIPVPKNPKEELKGLIEQQSRKLLPLPLEEMVLDTNVLDKHLLTETISPTAVQSAQTGVTGNGMETKFMRVLITAAPKTLVASYVTLFKDLGIELMSLETETFAMTRSLVGKEKSHVLLVDVGAERSNLAIVDQGIPLLTRVIKGGGNAITQALSQTMGIGFDEADAMKRDLGFAADGKLPLPILEALKPIVHEIRYALGLYAEQVGGSAKPVEKIVVTGGSAHLPGLSQYLTQSLNMNVYLGDPWARVLAPAGLRGILEEIGPRFSVAVGLAERLEEKI